MLLGPEGVGVIGTVDRFIGTVAQACALGLPFAAILVQLEDGCKPDFCQ